MDYLFTAREESHRYLYEEIASREKLGEVHSLQRSKWNGKRHYRIAFLTSHLNTEANVEEVVAAGRTRWKIENEDISTLKTTGCHIEHDFRH